jgi:tricorn protease
MRRLLCLFGLAVLLGATAATAAPADQTRLLRQPTVSATEIAFAYANNIWIVERSGAPRAV